MTALERASVWSNTGWPQTQKTDLVDAIEEVVLGKELVRALIYQLNHNVDMSVSDLACVETAIDEVFKKLERYKRQKAAVEIGLCGKLHPYPLAPELGGWVCTFRSGHQGECGKL